MGSSVGEGSGKARAEAGRVPAACGTNETSGTGETPSEPFQPFPPKRQEADDEQPPATGAEA